MLKASLCLSSRSLTVVLLANRLVRFVFQRHLETVLYGRSDGSSGPIWKVMNAAGIGSTTMTINKAAVTAGTITEAEFKAIMDTFKSELPADVVDPCSLGRIRNCTILPLAAAATVVRTFGRSAASMAWLRAWGVHQLWALTGVLVRHLIPKRGVCSTL